MPYLTPETKRNRGLKPTIIGIITILAISGIAYVAGKENSDPEIDYIKSQIESENYEYASPGNFLKADGTYNKTLFGRKFRVQGSVTNTASSATYKDAVVEITFYSKTKSKVSSSLVTVYEIFPPRVTKEFDVKVDAPAAAEEISLSVVDATRN